MQVNLRDANSVREALAGAEAAVNLVGILYEKGRQRFDEIHVGGARRVAEAVVEHGVRTLVHMSALGAAADASSHYARSKAAGESAVLRALPEAVILRPSLIFGPEDSLFNRFAAMARLSPVMPVVCGGTRFQPVFAGNVGDAVAMAIDGRARPGTIYELGGPEIKTMAEIIDYVLATTGRRRLTVPVPSFAARLQASVLEWLPKPPLTVDQVAQLGADNVVSSAAAAAGLTLEGLGISPTAIETVVPTYLYRYRKSGQFTRLPAL